MAIWENDDALFALAKRELFTAVVGDIMDQLGYLKQFLPLNIRPIQNDMVVIGRAMPVLCQNLTLEEQAEVLELSKHHTPNTLKLFGLMFEALDDLRKNEVYLCTGGAHDFALWGELMSTRAMKLGAAGVVLNGASRDTKAILELGFPTFSTGLYAVDQSRRGKITDFRTTVEIEGVSIHPGDIVFGDIDGIAIIPKEIEEPTFIGALEKVRGERRVLKAMQEGMSAVEAWATFGIL